MTAHRPLDNSFRAPMEKAGERYAAARRQVISVPPTAPHPHAVSIFRAMSPSPNPCSSAPGSASCRKSYASPPSFPAACGSPDSWFPRGPLAYS